MRKKVATYCKQLPNVPYDSKYKSQVQSCMMHQYMRHQHEILEGTLVYGNKEPKNKEELSWRCETCVCFQFLLVRPICYSS